MAKNGKSRNGVVPRKRRYERSTPVGRLMRNILKTRRVVAVSLTRVRSWGTTDEEVDSTRHWLEEADASLQEAESRIQLLMNKEWSPPKKSSAVTFEEGEEVQISAKYRDKYLAVYGDEVISELVISKILESGELAVRHGKATPFIVVKSHLERRREE